jgi:serum/glucocorticoid-regulated kinase 2
VSRLHLSSKYTNPNSH